MKLTTKLKKWFKSWTMNASGLLMVLGGIQANVATLDVSPKAMGWILMGLAALMAYLRYKTEAKPVLDER